MLDLGYVLNEACISEIEKQEVFILELKKYKLFRDFREIRKRNTKKKIDKKKNIVSA